MNVVSNTIPYSLIFLLSQREVSATFNYDKEYKIIKYKNIKTKTKKKTKI